MIFWSIPLLFLLDFFTKHWAKMVLTEKNFEIIPSFFSFSLHFNTGIAFSLPVSAIFQIIGTVFLLCGFAVYSWKNFSSFSEKFAFCLIVSGAMGNFYDRVVFAKVTDFISIWQFPIFNIADMLIFFGVCFLFWKEFSKEVSQK